MAPTSALRLSRPAVALWRSPGVLQVGLDSPALVLSGVPADLPLAIELLARPQGTDDLTRLLPDLDPEWIDWLVCRLDAAGLMSSPEPVRAAPLAVVGTGALADAVLDALTHATGTVIRVAPAALAGDGSATAGPVPELVILAGEFAEPDRMLTDALFRSGRAHLVVRLEPDRAVVGPLVLPGRSPCVRCHDLNRCRLDEAWPHLLAQLCRESVTAEPTLLAWAASTAAVQVRAWLAGGTPESTGSTLELGLADFRLHTRTWPAHPRCGCLLPIG
ncbi:MAG TPA: hypothetical protein VGK18_16520 [Propionicimonas sp.]|uniref:hypothetical protein n=1 Tax=Propionicimonas sp. TaxID=1955623 RepID=UPI002F416D8A